MGLRINTNVQSLQAQRALGDVKQSQSKTFAALSTGSRINQAGDDAAGLAISEKLKANIRGSRQAQRNASDGISLVQVAEGGLNEVSNILVRLRELSVQAASDTIGSRERQFTDKEYQQLTSELERIAQSTKYNDVNLLKGEGEKADFQVGINNDEFNDRISFNPEEISAKLEDLGLEGTSVQNKDNARENLGLLDNALDRVNSNRADLGALQNRLQKTITNLGVQTENLEAANSRIRDADIASESAELARTNILSAASSSVLAQANSSQQLALKLIG